MENLLGREAWSIDPPLMIWLCRYSNISIAWSPGCFSSTLRTFVSSANGRALPVSLPYDFELMPHHGPGSSSPNSLWQRGGLRVQEGGKISLDPRPNAFPGTVRVLCVISFSRPNGEPNRSPYVADEETEAQISAGDCPAGQPRSRGLRLYWSGCTAHVLSWLTVFRDTERLAGRDS